MYIVKNLNNLKNLNIIHRNDLSILYTNEMMGDLQKDPSMAEFKVQGT